MFWIERTERSPGSEIRIDCPVCLAPGVAAETYDQKQTDTYLGFIPLIVSRSTWVVCRQCGARLSSRVKAAELAGKTTDELAGLIALRASFLRKTLAVLGLLLAIVPFVGPVMAVIAFVANRKIPGWPKKISVAGLAIALLISAFLVFVMIFVD